MVNHNVGIIIQARMSSERLPKKSLLKLPYHSNRTLLENVVSRAQVCKNANKVVVATSENPENDILETTLSNKCEVFRGSEENVLSRFYLVSKMFKFDIIVRLTADNPCIDPYYVDQAITLHVHHQADYTRTKGLPLGMNVEVISFPPLQDAFEKSSKKEDLENVTYYIYSRGEKYKLFYPEVCKDYYDWRLTVDYESDYALMCLLYQSLYPSNNLFGYKEIKDFFQVNPWAIWINKENFQKKVYNSYDEEKEDALSTLKKYGFSNVASYLSQQNF